MVQKQASLHEKAVQKVARESITKPRRSAQPRQGGRSSRVRTTHVLAGVHPLLVAWVKTHVDDLSTVEVVSPNEVLIGRNRP